MVNSSTFSFDRSAAGFDLRAGLPRSIVAEIASAIYSLVADGAEEADGWLLDIGAGTGEIGAALCQITAHYLGLDLSLPMLHVFKDRAPDIPMLRADLKVTWPIKESSVQTIFASRTAHLLAAEHFCHECERVLERPGRLILGGVRRSPTGVRSRLRQRLHELLAERGIAGQRRGQKWRRFEKLLAARGFQAEKRRVATWPVAERAVDSLNAWRDKDGLAGRALPTAMHREVLTTLERWATQTHGDVHAAHPSEEHYEVLIFS